MQGHKVVHWEALRYCKDDSREQSCGSTLNIHQDDLKSGNLLYKRGFVDSQFGTTVCVLKISKKLFWDIMTDLVGIGLLKIGVQS